MYGRGSKFLLIVVVVITLIPLAAASGSQPSKELALLQSSSPETTTLHYCYPNDKEITMRISRQHILSRGDPHSPALLPSLDDGSCDKCQVCCATSRFYCCPNEYPICDVEEGFCLKRSGDLFGVRIGQRYGLRKEKRPFWWPFEQDSNSLVVAKRIIRRPNRLLNGF